jgi:hypothetical protein
MNRDSFAGAVHGLGKRGRCVGIANHGRAGEPVSRQDHNVTDGRSSTSQNNISCFLPDETNNCAPVGIRVHTLDQE